MTDFAQRLCKTLKEKGITRKQFAVDIGITDSTLTRYLRGDRTPNIYIVYQMCKILNVSCDWLIGLDTSKIDCNRTDLTNN